MISLSRRESCTKFADEIAKLRGEKALIDFEIHVNGSVFPCTKFLMAAHSPMLRAMLTSDMVEVTNKKVEVNDISDDVIQIILDYMYFEDVTFCKDLLMDLIAASDYLQMMELKEICLEEVPGILEPINVILWWQEACKMNYDNIKDKCEKIIADNFHQVSQQTDFLQLDLGEVLRCIKSMCSNSVKNDDILDGTMKWVSHEEKRVTHLENLLHKVSLKECSAEGIKAVMKTNESLLDKTPMIYKLLSSTLADIATVAETVVVVGGEEDHDPNQECWKVKSNQMEYLTDIPMDFSRYYSANSRYYSARCKVPQGFVITGGDFSSLCFMFTAATKLWVRLQDLMEIRDKHGSICVKNVLYVHRWQYRS